MTDLYSLLYSTGGAIIIGAIIGSVARRMANVIAFITGIQIAFFTYLDYINIIDINFDAFTKIIDTIRELFTTLRFPDNVEAMEVYSAGGIVSGFLFGLIIGFYRV